MLFLLGVFQSLLDEPNPNSPANNTAAQLYQENRREYEKRVASIVEESWIHFWEWLHLFCSFDNVLFKRTFSSKQFCSELCWLLLNWLHLVAGLIWSVREFFVNCFRLCLPMKSSLHYWFRWGFYLLGVFAKWVSTKSYKKPCLCDTRSFHQLPIDKEYSV